MPSSLPGNGDCDGVDASRAGARLARPAYGRSLEEAFARREKAPLACRQIAQDHLANAHALQSEYLQADRFAHAAYLALFSFAQHEAQLIFVLPRDLRRLQRLALAAQ